MSKQATEQTKITPERIPHPSLVPGFSWETAQIKSAKPKETKTPTAPAAPSRTPNNTPPPSEPGRWFLIKRGVSPSAPPTYAGGAAAEPAFGAAVCSASLPATRTHWNMTTPAKNKLAAGQDTIHDKWCGNTQ